MRMPTSHWILFLVAFLATTKVMAADQPDGDAATFRQRLIMETKLLKPDADAKWLKHLSYAPDAAVKNALNARTLDEALEAIKAGRLQTLSEASQALPEMKLEVPKLDGRKLTIVVVPGVFAEFIKNRAFEDVLEQPSKFRETFKEQVAALKKAGNPNATDRTTLLHEIDPTKLEAAQYTQKDLSELLHLGQMTVHGAQVRVVLFATPFSSMESLGSNESRAAIFIRRLDKYLAITGPQDLAFVGYSRGTPLGLEILSQASKANKPWVKDVKGMISLSGVVLGSSLADDATKNDRSPTKKLLEGLQKTGLSLEKYPEGQSPGWLLNRGIVNSNDVKWAKFGAEALPLVAELNKGNPLEAAKQLLAVDPRAPVGIAFQMWADLGLAKPHKEYNQNIDRFNWFVEQLLTSVKELSSEARVAWFKSHELPKNVTYYAIPAAMANPGANAVEKELFSSPLGYGHGSYDDTMLIQNRKDYEAISNGIALNDSQVSVIQSSFPSGVLESLSSKHQGLKTKFLGVCGTHHWGMALREVNKMHMGQVNGFPREALLRTLATQVLLDSAN